MFAQLTPRGSRPLQNVTPIVDPDAPFTVICTAFILLAKPLTLDHNNNRSTRRHQAVSNIHLERICNFKDELSSMYNLGSLIPHHRDEMAALVDQYVQLLRTRCQQLLDEYNSFEPLPPPTELLSPRSRARAQQAQEEMKQAQKTVKTALAKQDASVNMCIADICVLIDAFEAEKEKISAIPPPAEEHPSRFPRLAKVWDFFKRKNNG